MKASATRSFLINGNWNVRNLDRQEKPQKGNSIAIMGFSLLGLSLLQIGPFDWILTDAESNFTSTSV